MNESNSYKSPRDSSAPPDAMDQKLVRVIAMRLAQARKSPPTVLSLLCKWPGTPLTLVVGVVCTAILVLLSRIEGSTISSHWPISFAAFIIGAVLRDIGIALRVARLWKPQSHFIDWKKVDEFSG